MNVESMPKVLCARQPIFDYNLDIYGYELLYRGDNEETFASFKNGDSATSRLILNAFTELPFEGLLEQKKGFVNFTRELLRSPPPLGENEIVIEILEDIEFDEGLLADVRSLKSMGYLIALDDYNFREGDLDMLAIADIIKVDVLHGDFASIEREISRFRPYKAKLLAEKIETKTDFVQCKDLGFVLFQGHFLSKPTLISGRKLSEDQLAVLRLLKVLQNTESEFSDIQIAISSSASLTFKLLRLLNSSAFSFACHIDSVHKAITILGLEKIRSWGTMLALSNVSDKPKVLSSNALIRAYMCRSLGSTLSLDEYSDTLFTMGLLSTLDAFLDISLDKIIESLNLSDWVKKALLGYEGSMGLILETAVNFEIADFDKVDFIKMEKFGASQDDIQSAYERSVLLAAEVMDSFS